MARSDRRHPNGLKPLSLLLALISYVAGIFTGSIATTWSSTSDVGVITTCGDAPQYVASKFDENESRTYDVRNATGFTTPSSVIEHRIGRNRSKLAHQNVPAPVDFDAWEYKDILIETIERENKKAKRDRPKWLSPASSLTDSYSEVVLDIIPEFLLPRYATEHLQFPITRNMLRQSRLITGNTQRLHAYLNKLLEHKCTTVLFLGGSVTKGHKAGGFVNAYPRFFMDFLNSRYPCIANGTIGSHESKFLSSYAHSSQEIVVNWPVVAGIESFDLVLLEFNINDAFMPSFPHSLENKGQTGSNSDYYRSGWYFEVLLRRLLLLRKPDPVAIVTFSADYEGSQWADRSVATWAKKDTIQNARKTLFRKNQEPIKAYISSLYQIPMFSATVWMLPLHSKAGMKDQFRRGRVHSTDAWEHFTHFFGEEPGRANMKWSTLSRMLNCAKLQLSAICNIEHCTVSLGKNNVFWRLHWGESCCHPHREGHLILSLVLAYCLVEEEKFMMYDKHYEHSERDLTTDDKPRLRDPIYLSPEEESFYIHNSMNVSALDFTDPARKEAWKDFVILNDRWNFLADNIDQDKYGLIANDIKGAHIVLSITGGKLGLVEISYVTSYENFGDSIAWMTEPNDNKIHYLCGRNHFGTGQRLDVDRLSGHWTEHASIPTLTILKQKVKEGDRKALHICLLPHAESQPWKENKFKLLGIRLY